jgi:GLPGLI family protein
MKSLIFKTSLLLLTILISTGFYKGDRSLEQPQDFQGQAYYLTKSNMELGKWGARLNEAQKKQIAARLKNRLEKTYVLTFNKEESFFDEEDKLDAMSGATDSWGKNFTQGNQYKNVKTNSQVQNQEFYGKKFLVKDSLLAIDWKMGKETKVIGNYTCFKAMALIPTNDLTWYDFSWDRLRNNSNENVDSSNDSAEAKEKEEVTIQMTQVEAWYTPQIPVSHGPSEYWGLPGLILEVSAGNTTMLCSKIVMNPEKKMKIEAPDKGKEITKTEYQKTIVEKMKDFRNQRMGRRRG